MKKDGLNANKNEWSLIEKQHQPEKNLYWESIFALGNNFLSARSSLSKRAFLSFNFLTGV